MDQNKNQRIILLKGVHKLKWDQIAAYLGELVALYSLITVQS